MPAILALRVMLGLIHLFQLYVSQIYKTILSNGHEDRVALVPLCYATQGFKGYCGNSIAIT